MRRQKGSKKKFILGLTGTFGSGKSTCAGFFRGLGALVLDADKIAHKCIRLNKPAYKKIIRLFGGEILKKNGSIDRKKLARIVFNDTRLLARLNNIVHPEVIRDIKSEINSSKAKVIVLDVPLLIESGLTRIADKLAVVKIPRKTQIERIQNKTSLGRSDILSRIRCQLPQSAKIGLADFIIDNAGSRVRTKKQVIKIWKTLQP